MKLFLDDARLPMPGWIRAIGAREAIQLMLSEGGHITHLSLDHDLVEGHPDGFEFVKAMVSLHMYADKIYFHSGNPAGRANMYALLDTAQRVGVIPDTIEIMENRVPPGFMEMYVHDFD